MVKHIQTNKLEEDSNNIWWEWTILNFSCFCPSNIYKESGRERERECVCVCNGTLSNSCKLNPTGHKRRRRGSVNYLNKQRQHIVCTGVYIEDMYI